MSRALFPNNGTPNVLTMPAGEPFLALLAKGLSESLGPRLGDALILLPTRRAVRELGEAFTALGREQSGGGRASLLPMMRPLADVEPDEPPFEPGELAHTIAPAIDPVRRRFELSRLVLQMESALRARAPDPAGALAMTEPLLRLLDDSFMEELTREDLSELDAIIELSAKHYQDAAVFYKIIANHWPQFLKDNQVMDPMQRRVALLGALTEHWGESPPNHPVIIAGSTGTLDATARLMSLVSRLDEGLIVLPGLDRHIDMEDVWDKVGPAHPQGALRRLLKTIGIERADVNPWPGITSDFNRESRRRIIAQSLIPTAATSDWLARIDRIREGAPLGYPITAALEGLSLIETESADEEAASIALILRETLSTDGASAALVTPDPALGRRVAAKLTRWDITVDVSAGQPLEEAPAGTFLSLVLTLASDPWNPVALAALFKHKLTHLGRKPKAARRLWEQIERAGFRGARPNSFDELSRRYAVKKGDYSEHFVLIESLHNALGPLTALAPKTTNETADETYGVDAIARVHCLVAESLAASDAISGADTLWRGEGGEAAGKLLSDLLRHGDILGAVNADAYGVLLAGLMRGRVVRPRFGTHPRLQILGPLEARMLRADVVVLGGLNEGVWPAAPSVDPLLSYGMREAVSLSSPERRYGLASHDFAQLAASPRVILTRAKKSDDGPMVASRWIWRLKTLLRGALGQEGALTALAPATDYLAIARALDHVPAGQVRPTRAPMPRPPIARRWPHERRLSVTQIETLSRDPYSIYAKKVLGLEVLGALDEPLGPREYGSAVHKALEDFTIKYPKTIPASASQWLETRLGTALREAGYPPEIMAREGARLARMAQWFTEWEQTRREQGWRPVAVERKARWELHAPGSAPFALTAEADRIDAGPRGYAIIDYKTGNPPSPTQVNLGFNSQLPLEGAMLDAGAFDGDLPALELAQLLYVKVQGRKSLGSESRAVGKKGDLGQVVADAYEGMLALISHFDNPDWAYASQPRAEFGNQNKYGDFDHLARRAEWASASDGDANGNGGRDGG